MKKGKLIVIEGACDGIGKSTQYNLLGTRLVKDGEEVVRHHFPSYKTSQGALVERYLHGEFGRPQELSPYFINSLYAMDRAITWNTELAPQFLEGKTILLDRYTTSSLIYQSALIEDMKRRKEFIDYVYDFEYQKLGIKKADVVIFLKASFDLVSELRRKRKINEGVTNDIHERDLEFMKKVYDNALFLADYLNWDTIVCDNGHEMKSIDTIHEEIYRLVKKK